MFALTLGLWALGCFVLALLSRRASVVYWCSTVAAIVPVALSQTKYGFLPMAGVFHVLVMGIYPCVVFWVANFLRHRRSQIK